MIIHVCSVIHPNQGIPRSYPFPPFSFSCSVDFLLPICRTKQEGVDSALLWSLWLNIWISREMVSVLSVLDVDLLREDVIIVCILLWEWCSVKRAKLRKKMEKMENQSSKSNQPTITTIVPSSQWKVMDSSVTVTNVSSEIPVATLLYYATCVKYEDSPPSSPRSSSF